jgi:hypothetical protein
VLAAFPSRYPAQTSIPAAAVPATRLPHAIAGDPKELPANPRV